MVWHWKYNPNLKASYVSTVESLGDRNLNLKPTQIVCKELRDEDVPSIYIITTI